MLAPIQLLSASHQNLLRLTWIRLLVLSAQAGTLGFTYLSGMVSLQWWPLVVLLLLSLSMCILTSVRLRVRWPVTELEFSLHLAMDLFIHSGLLYYVGGSTNPFVAYYLVPLTIAAATLPWLYSVVLSGLALSGYTALLIWYRPLQLQAEAVDQLLITLHLFGMWLNFALSAAFITFFVSKMSEAIREQDQLRAARREDSLRDQQLLAVATQAAGAAHELSTPLSTMSVLLSELRHEYRAEKHLQEDLQLLQEQVKLCKGTLQHLVRAAEAERRQAVVEQSATDWLTAVLNRWHLMRPEVTYRYQVLGVGATPTLLPAVELTQALLNLLNNAADACPNHLEIALAWEREWIVITIRDYGAGVPLAIAEQLGKPFFTTKGKGFGLGLFLSHMSVIRAGGTVKLYNQEGGGTLTELRLPQKHGVF